MKFNYSHKEYNKAGKGKYILNGYLWRDIQEKIKDHVCIENDTLIAIETDVSVNKQCNAKYLDKYFEFDDGVYKSKDKFKVIKSNLKLREYLYENGFICDGIKYVRWKRSSGSSRVGKCLFINEALYKRMHKWETCGLPLKEGCEIDLAALEAYISLTSSSIIGTLELNPENFLIVDDYESVFKDTVVGVQLENGQLIAREQEFEIRNSIFDGESLLDESCFPEEYKNYSMILLRQRMFKSACFKAKVQKWFSDNNITDISQLNGVTTAKNISEIKIITTPSSIKYVKFGSLQKWLDILEPTFGIVKHEKPTHYFDGQKVRTHYQLLNTLQLTEEDIQELLKPSFDYMTKIRNNPAVLKYHICCRDVKSIDEVETAAIRNEIVRRLLEINADFTQTDIYYNFRNDIIKQLKEELKCGHILVNGNNSTLLGNGYELLQHSIGIFEGKSIIGRGNIYSNKFEFGKTLLCCRSPHICSGNILLVKNAPSNEIDEYFDLSDEVVYINDIGENIQQRLMGCDYDSDTILLTDNQLFIEAAQKNYNKFKVPTCFIPAKNKERYYTNEQKTDLDYKTSVNRIGEIVNLSQWLNSLLWERIYNGESFDQNKELYYDICKLAVLSGIEIDKAKKEFELNTFNALDTIKKKYFLDKNGNQKPRPLFFEEIDSKKREYNYYNTSMDYVAVNVKNFNFHNQREKSSERKPFSIMVCKMDKSKIGKSYYQQCDNILKDLEKISKEINELFNGYDDLNDDEKKEKREQAKEKRQECIDCINNRKINSKTMGLLLDSLECKTKKFKKNGDEESFDKPRRRFRKIILDALFGAKNKDFYGMLIKNKNVVKKLVMANEGDNMVVLLLKMIKRVNPKLKLKFISPSIF